jgi:hypothetical protein
MKRPEYTLHKIPGSETQIRKDGKIIAVVPRVGGKWAVADRGQAELEDEALRLITAAMSSPHLIANTDVTVGTHWKLIDNQVHLVDRVSWDGKVTSRVLRNLTKRGWVPSKPRYSAEVVQDLVMFLQHDVVRVV